MSLEIDDALHPACTPNWPPPASSSWRWNAAGGRGRAHRGCVRCTPTAKTVARSRPAALAGVAADPGYRKRGLRHLARDPPRTRPHATVVGVARAGAVPRRCRMHRPGDTGCAVGRPAPPGAGRGGTPGGCGLCGLAADGRDADQDGVVGDDDLWVESGDSVYDHILDVQDVRIIAEVAEVDFEQVELAVAERPAGVFDRDGDWSVDDEGAAVHGPREGAVVALVVSVGVGLGRRDTTKQQCAGHHGNGGND